MWENSGYDNAGGFYNESQGGETKTPGGTDRKRANNIVPVFIRDILDSGEDGMKVEGLEVGIATIVARVIGVQQGDTKATYTVEDNTGSLDAILWKDEQTGKGMEDDIAEGQDVRVVGTVRANPGGDGRHMMTFKISPVSCDEEVESHKLEVSHSKLLIKNMNEKENAAIGANNTNYGLSNSMVGTGNAPATPANSFGNPKYDKIYKIVSATPAEEGISRFEVQKTANMPQNEVDNALEWLSNEGHVYSTMDEDHFKTTDS